MLRTSAAEAPPAMFRKMFFEDSEKGQDVCFRRGGRGRSDLNELNERLE